MHTASVSPRFPWKERKGALFLVVHIFFGGASLRANKAMVCLMLMVSKVRFRHRPEVTVALAGPSYMQGAGPHFTGGGGRVGGVPTYLAVIVGCIL